MDNNWSDVVIFRPTIRVSNQLIDSPPKQLVLEWLIVSWRLSNVVLCLGCSVGLTNLISLGCLEVLSFEWLRRQPLAMNKWAGWLAGVTLDDDMCNSIVINIINFNNPFCFYMITILLVSNENNDFWLPPSSLSTIISLWWSHFSLTIPDEKTSIYKSCSHDANIWSYTIGLSTTNNNYVRYLHSFVWPIINYIQSWELSYCQW